MTIKYVDDQLKLMLRIQLNYIYIYRTTPVNSKTKNATLEVNVMFPNGFGPTCSSPQHLMRSDSLVALHFNTS